jgi:Flp pilus assembly protein TadD
MSQADFSGALAMCRAGRFAEAEPQLRTLVARSPSHAEALQLLGVVVASLGRTEESLAWFDRAKAARPRSLAFMQNRAHALFTLGRLADARAEVDAMLAIDAAYAPARHLLALVTHEEGVAHHAAGRFAPAIDAYRRAIAGGLALPQAHANLGNALKMTGRDDEALGQFAEAARLEPDAPAALANLGGALNDAGRSAEALALLERAVALDPTNASAHNFLGATYFSLNRPAEAVESHGRALALRPDFDAARNNLGNALSAVGRKEEALQAFREALARNPADANLLCNSGAVLQDLGRFDEARANFQEALRVHPDFPMALNNLGFLLREEGRIAEATALFERCLQVSPGNARAAYNLALARLGERRFEEGWRLHEARFRTTPPATVWREFPVPLFGAGDFAGAHRIAVWREQGIGDQILYATTLADLEARGVDFVLEFDARLVAAVRRAHPRWAVVAPQDAQPAFARCDRHAPMAHMAGLLRPSPESFAGQPRAFVAADVDRARHFRSIVAVPGRRVIGISWRSFQPKGRAYVESRKSAPLAAFEPLAARGDLRLVDLQYGDTAGERGRFRGELARIEGLDLFNDLEGVLAAIEACDVVVTTSSVTAHLAGAAGKPTLLVYLRGLPPFHYWATDAEGRCLWYPSLRIATVEPTATWEQAIERVDELLDR